MQKAIRQPIPPVDQITNTEALGRVLYTDYVYYFQAAGIVLLVAMVGAIVLTLRHRVPVKRQDMAAQVRAHQGGGDRGRKVRPGQGLDMTIGLGHYLAVAAILFTLGILGIFINRKNVIVILMSIELILLAVNINLWCSRASSATWSARCSRCWCSPWRRRRPRSASRSWWSIYRNRGSIAVEDINLMKG